MGSNFYAIQFQGLNISAFRFVTILLPLLCVIIIINHFMKKNCCKKLRQRHFTDLFYTKYIDFLLIWCIYALCSILWAASLYYWFISTYFLILGVICALIFNLSIKNIKHILHCVYIVWFICVIHACIGWLEILSGKYYFLYDVKDIIIYKTNMMPISSFGNTNDFATCMLIGIFISLGLMSLYQSKFLRLFMLLNIMSMFTLVVFSSSRANIIGFLLGMSFLRLMSSNRSFLKNFFTLCLIYVVAVVISAVLYPTLLTNIRVFCEALISSASEGTSINIRKNLILNGIYFLKETYFCGVGAGNSAYYMLTRTIFPTWGIINMHNWWMEVLVDYGVIIFWGYISFYIRMIIENIKIYRTYYTKDKSYIYGIAMSFVGFLIAYSFASISSSSNMSNEFVWIIFAIILAFLNVCRKQKFFE